MGPLAELSGWIGALSVLAGYACFSLGWIGGGRLFQASNLIGSTALLANGYYHGAWPSVVLNCAWATISAVAMFRTRKAPRAETPGAAVVVPNGSGPAASEGGGPGL